MFPATRCCTTLVLLLELRLLGVTGTICVAAACLTLLKTTVSRCCGWVLDMIQT